MVSKASEDLPEPETPVTTVSALCGTSKSMFLRLCTRAPRTTMLSCSGVLVGSVTLSDAGMKVLERLAVAELPAGRLNREARQGHSTSGAEFFIVIRFCRA